MISNNIRYFSITRLAALVLLAICFVQLNVRAQEPQPEPAIAQAALTSAAEPPPLGTKDRTLNLPVA